MKKWRAGFTIIEITLFLAITGLLFMGIMVGTQNSINQQRAYDSVQSFAEFLRSVYSGVTNPQSQLVGGGKSDKALYGKMITFGEEKDLTGKVNDRGQIFVYDVIGNIDPTKAGNNGKLGSIYGGLDLNVKDEDNKLVGIPEDYIPRWQSKIQKTDRDNFEGTILILRHPNSGTVNTLFSELVLEVNDKDSKIIGEEIKEKINSFESKQIDFCISLSDDQVKKRTDVRIISGAHNASGIQIIDLDNNKDNLCN